MPKPLTNSQRPIKPPPAPRSPKELVASSFWSWPPNDNPPSLEGLTQEQKDYWYSIFDTLEETMKRGCKLMYEANQRAVKDLKC